MIHWLPLLPVWIIVLAGLIYLILVFQGRSILLRKQVPGREALSLTGLRLVIGVVLLLLLLRPVLSFTHNEELLPDLLVLVDTSESMAQPGAKAGATRLDEIREALGGALGTSLRSRQRLRLFAFDRTARAVADSGLPGLHPDGTQTLLADSLGAAVEQLRAEGRAPERVLVATDGNDLGSEDPAAVARRLGLSIDTLAPGSPSGESKSVPPAIIEVQGARRVLLGSETHFRVTVGAGHARGLAAPLSLHLLEDGKEVGTASVAFAAGESQQRAELAHRPATAGFHRYEFRLDDAEPSQSLNVQVVDGKTEVLILEETWRWEFRYLRRVFEDDPSFRFTAILARGGGAMVQFGSPDRRARLLGMPQGEGELAEFDTIVLGDVDVRRWPPRLAAALAAQVRDEGKSLIVVAGPNIATLADVPELHTLLPIELARESGEPVGGPVEVRVSPDGTDSPFAVQASEPAGLPPLDQVYPPLRKRAGASVLLEAARLKNSYGNLIVMAEQTVGRGRVLYVGTDTLWKWQTRADPNASGVTPYRLFWQQALRALTPLQPRHPGVSLTVESERSQSARGRTIALVAEVATDRPIAESQVQATLTLPDESRTPLVFSADPTDPGLWRSELSPNEPGSYRITARLVTAGQTLAEAEALLDVPAAGGERTDAGVNHAALSRLAAATGGRLIDSTRPETYTNPRPAAGPRAVIAREKTVDLWENYSLVLVLVALLGIDWLIRLRRGFV